jgi:hypothetical protein
LIPSRKETVYTNLLKNEINESDSQQNVKLCPNNIRTIPSNKMSILVFILSILVVNKLLMIGTSALELQKVVALATNENPV